MVEPLLTKERLESPNLFIHFHIKPIDSVAEVCLGLQKQFIATRKLTTTGFFSLSTKSG